MKAIVIFLLISIHTFVLSYFVFPRICNHFSHSEELLAPVIEREQELALQQYTFRNLQSYSFQTSAIDIERIIEDHDDYVLTQGSYQTMDQNMSLAITIPKNIDHPPPVIILIRGWAPRESYYTSMGSKNIGISLAKQGYLTIAPDFFSYGSSDEEPENSWEARFVKPVNIIELIKSLEAKMPVRTNDVLTPETIEYQAKIGIWGHSNGGQIAISSIQILEQDIPTSLFAPVLAPFPYSILFFSNQHQDEGKETRAWLSIFERDYDVFDFSISRHLDLLSAPIQIHHGTADHAALHNWSENFVKLVERENSQRQRGLNSFTQEEDQDLPPIEIQLITHRDADHNLRPHWHQAVATSIAFFDQHLKNN